MHFVEIEEFQESMLINLKKMIIKTAIKNFF